jgi:hypothetical protein
METHQRLAVGLLVGFAGAQFTLSGCAKATAQATGPAGPSSVELTVYKDDFAMVHESRPVDVAAGTSHLRLGDVSHSLDPTSVIFRTPKGSEVVGSTYDLGVGSGSNLMQRLSGKDVELIWQSDTGREGDRIKGRLEPAADGGFLIRSGDKVYLNPKGTLVAPSDDALSTLPGLSVQVESDAHRSESLDVSYLTRGMSWTADYVAHLDPESDQMRLECWAAVTNQTGVPFRDAKVTFVAGSPNRAAHMAQNGGRASFGEAPKAVVDNAAATVNAPYSPLGELYELQGAESRDDRD